MGQGPTGVTRQNILVHYWNAGVHQNKIHTETEKAEVQENEGVQANTNAPHNDHHDPQNDSIIKIENTTDTTEDDKN